METSAAEKKLEYRIVDADNHYYEPDDCFTRHIEARFRGDTVHFQREDPKGIGRVFLGAERLAFFSVGPSDHVGAPGAMRSFFRGETEQGGAVNLSPIDPAEHPEFSSRKARLALMDRQQVEATIMLPTLGVGVEYQLREHPELLYPSLRSFNRWIQEDWGYGADGRIFCPPLISLLHLPSALEELERVLREGARLVLINAGPVAGRSPADPSFEPFWARVEEAGVVVAYHIGATGFCEMYAHPWGETPNPPSHRFSALQTFLGIGERCITDTAAALILHNLFGRFPALRVVVIEHGSNWVKPLLRTLDKLYRMADHKDRWRFGKPPQRPSEIFRKHFRIVPFYEDDIPTLARTIGVENVLNGSDFPHPEGLAWPQEFLDSLEAFEAPEQRLIMRDNAAQLLGLSP